MPRCLLAVALMLCKAGADKELVERNDCKRGSASPEDAHAVEL